MRKSRYFLLLSILLSIIAAQGLLLAGDTSLRVYGQFRLGVSGDLSDSFDMFSYDELFSNGAGFGLELSHRFMGGLDVLMGIGYVSQDGENLPDLSLDDWSTLPVYAGLRYHFREAGGGLDPYIRFDLGLGKISDVDFSRLGDTGRYWDSTWSALAGFGVGLEYRFSKLGLFMELKGQYLGAPEMTEITDLQSADGSWSIPFNIGLAYYF